MAYIASVDVTVTTAGGAGVATGTTDSVSISGFLLDVYLNYHTSAPATTDVTISYATPAGGNILVVTDVNTDVLKTPRVKPVDNAGTAITNAHDRFPLNGTLTVAVAGCDALTGALVATIRYMCL